MICPNCLVQMHQKDKMGGGVSNSDKYETWEIKECPSCGRLVKEFYSCEVISLVKAQKLVSDKTLGESLTIIEPVEETV